MQSQATTVDEYLAELPVDRRLALSAVRDVILKNLDKDYAEGMQYGMIGYFVPHSVFPAGYHCDPTQPLCFAGLASQKNHMSLYLMCIYGSEQHATWFQESWAKTGKKLDMGKSCVRFKKLEDLALDVIAAAIRRVPAKKYVADYVAIRESLAQRKVKGPPKRASAKSSLKVAKKKTKTASSKKRTTRGRNSANFTRPGHV